MYRQIGTPGGAIDGVWGPPARHAAALAPVGLPPGVVRHIRCRVEAVAGARGDDRPDPSAGVREPPVGVPSISAGNSQARPPVTTARLFQHLSYPVWGNDAKYGPRFAWLAAASGVQLLDAPFRTPRTNAAYERFLGGVQRECGVSSPPAAPIMAIPVPGGAATRLPTRDMIRPNSSGMHRMTRGSDAGAALGCRDWRNASAQSRLQDHDQRARLQPGWSDGHQPWPGRGAPVV